MFNVALELKGKRVWGDISLFSYYSREITWHQGLYPGMTLVFKQSVVNFRDSREHLEKLALLHNRCLLCELGLGWRMLHLWLPGRPVPCSVSLPGHQVSSFGFWTDHIKVLHVAVLLRACSSHSQILWKEDWSLFISLAFCLLFIFGLGKDPRSWWVLQVNVSLKPLIGPVVESWGASWIVLETKQQRLPLARDGDTSEIEVVVMTPSAVWNPRRLRQMWLEQVWVKS